MIHNQQNYKKQTFEMIFVEPSSKRYFLEIKHNPKKKKSIMKRYHFTVYTFTVELSMSNNCQ